MEIITAYLTQIFSFKALKTVGSWIFMGISFIFWDLNFALIACGILYMTDLFLWMGVNAYRGTWDWNKLRKWVFKFILYGIAIIVWNMVDLLVVHQDIEFWARNIIILYLGITEALSVLKHLASMWLHIPLKLINRLEGMRDDLDLPWSQPLTVSPLIQKGTSTSPSLTQSQDSQTEV